MATTYEKIATTTVSGSSTTTITFNSIAASWTDLRLVLVAESSAAAPVLTFNSDTATNYSRTQLYGDGASAASNRTTNASSLTLAAGTTGIPRFSNLDIFSYGGSTYKTSLLQISADDNGSGNVRNYVNLWRSTAAITRIDLTVAAGYLVAGTTATLYGILKA